MTDKELLELAAKAIGGTFSEGHTQKRSSETSDDWKWIGEPGIQTPEHWKPHGRVVIHPLTDDGDALRLAVELKLFLDLEHCNAANSNQSVPVWFGGGEDENAGVSHDECDPCEATRRAIVRAAAEIGKATS